MPGNQSCRQSSALHPSDDTEFPCSNDGLIISILRRGHGKTTIDVGDIITAYARPDVHEVVLREFGRPPHPEHSAEPTDGLQKHGVREPLATE